VILVTIIDACAVCLRSLRTLLVLTCHLCSKASGECEKIRFSVEYNYIWRSDGVFTGPKNPQTNLT